MSRLQEKKARKATNADGAVRFPDVALDDVSEETGNEISKLVRQAVETHGKTKRKHDRKVLECAVATLADFNKKKADAKKKPKEETRLVQSLDVLQQ